MPNRVIMYVDPSSRNIRRLSLQISAMSKFEPNAERFTEGMLNLLNKLRKEDNNSNKITVQRIAELNSIRSFIKGAKNTFYECEDKMDNIMRYSCIKTVVGLRIKEQRLSIIG